MSDPSARGMPRPASPFRPNLEQQRKRAKELLRGLRAGEAEALRRFRAHHPRWSAPGPDASSPVAVRLSEAQFVVARELGLPSWPRLKEHITAMDGSWARIQGGGPAPDRDRTTLHIRCGSDIEEALKQAGFTGDFLEYADPLCQGPVRNRPDWLEERAAFITESYGEGSGMGRGAIATKLRAAEEGLHAAVRYERVVLWFEHDTYDQLILARCLAAFAERPPPRLELISPGGFPGGMRFIGLGQLPPEALRLLWAERLPVTDEALAAGRAAWDALRAADPTALAALAARGTAGIPQLGAAMRRHLQELPGTRDGLGLSQRLILGLLAEGTRTAAEVFGALMVEREPLPWMTDLIFHDVLEGLRQVRTPVIAGAPDGHDGPWAEEVLSITALGHAVLAGTVDWMSLAPPARWVGGVAIPHSSPCWRWEETSTSVKLS